MPRIRVNGRLGPVAKAPKIEFDPQRGQVIVQEFQCAGAGLAGHAQIFAQLRIPYSWDLSPHVSKLVARASGAAAGIPEITVDTWQILCNELQKDILECSAALTVEAAYPGTLGYIRRDIDLYNQGKNPANPRPAAGAQPTYNALLDLMKRGTTHFGVSQYVLKHTTTVSNYYSKNVADTNIGKVYTTAQLLTETTSAAAWAYPLPARLKYKIQNLEAPPVQTNYLWGWRKLGSTESTAAHSRIEISTEYWLEQWSTILYPAAVLA
jgi:hypothetical protein